MCLGGRAEPTSKTETKTETKSETNPPATLSWPAFELVRCGCRRNSCNRFVGEEEDVARALGCQRFRYLHSVKAVFVKAVYRKTLHEHSDASASATDATASSTDATGA